MLENLSIVWEEITKAKEPIIVDSEGYIELTKPYSIVNKKGKKYSFLYINVIASSKYNNFIIPFMLNVGRAGYLGALQALCYNGYTNECSLIKISHLSPGVTKIYKEFSSSLEVQKIEIYGGYIKIN